MKKLSVLLLALFIITMTAFAAEDEEKKAEFSFTFGGGFPQLDTSSTYVDSWSFRQIFIFSVREGGSIAVTSTNGMFFGGSFAYYFSEKVGIQAGFGYLKADISSDFSFNIEWEPYSDSTSGTGTGELTVIPININVITKFSNGKLGGYFSGGYTLFNNKFNSTTGMGYGYWYRVIIIPLLDAAIVNLDIDESWSGHGMNVGGGFDFKVSENMAINADVRYYYCPSKEFDWNWQTGRYTGFIVQNPISIDFDNGDAQYASEYISSIEVNPSFFQIAAGIKFFF